MTLSECYEQLNNCELLIVIDTITTCITWKKKFLNSTIGWDTLYFCVIFKAKITVDLIRNIYHLQATFEKLMQIKYVNKVN